MCPVLNLRFCTQITLKTVLAVTTLVLIIFATGKPYWVKAGPDTSLSVNKLHHFPCSSLVYSIDVPSIELSNETDLKPNTEVPDAFSRSHINWKKEVIFPKYPDPILQTHIFEVIKAERNLINQGLRTFVQAFGNRTRQGFFPQNNETNFMEINLNDNWQFRKVNNNKWYKATVPGTVHNDLLDNNLIDDPFYRFNEDKVQWVEDEDWEYRTVFNVTMEMLEKQALQLYFQGLDTYAHVFLNGQRIHESDNMFVGFRVDCKPYLKEEENELRIVFQSPVRRGQERLDRFGHPLPAANELAPADKRTNPFTRKAPFHYGWDWGPRLVTSGIWRPVLLQAWDEARIKDLYLVTTEISENRAKINTWIELRAEEETSGFVYVLVNGVDIGIRHPINLAPGITISDFTFHIENPKLWWPNGLGDPYLYDLSFILETQSGNQHTHSLRYGVRTIQLVQESDELGRSFHFEVNGIPVFMKGANVIPPETLTAENEHMTYSRMIENAVAANMNMLRVWGGAVYKDNLFYQLCDENGLLVWQDFMFACSLQPGNEEHLENIRQEAEYNIRRLRNHASIALWCGNNENLHGWHHWGWQDMYDDEMKQYLWNTYQWIFYEILPDAVNRLDPKTSYWSSSPSSYGDQPADRKSGDEHDWTIWFGHKPFSAFWEEVPRFVSEWGLQAYPAMATIDSFASPADRQWNSAVMKHRQRSRMDWFQEGFDGNDNIRKYMEMYYNVPEDFDEFVYVSQLMQAKGYKTAIEAHRSSMPHCMGTLYWQLNDVWPTISWATLDYYYRWKAAHYAVKKAFSPVIVTTNQQEELVNIYAVSDKLLPFDARLLVKLVTLSGRVLYENEMKAEVLANSSKLLVQENLMEYLDKYGKENLVMGIQLIVEKQVVAENIHYFTEPKNLKLPGADINYQLNKTEDGYQVTFDAEVLIKGLSVEIPDADFSDNFFDLLPGTQKSIAIHTQKKLNREDLNIRYLNP